MSIKILLADDHDLVRDGICALLEKEDGIEVVSEACDGRSAIDKIRILPPDVVILDVAMPNLNGIETTRIIKSEFPEIKVLALSIHCDSHYVDEMLKAGASGYMLKSCAKQELVHAIHKVNSGQGYLSPSITNVVLENYTRNGNGNSQSPYEVLSAREREVLQLIAEGKASKEVAVRLSVSVRTIDAHRQNIMKKLNLYSVAELTKYAIREGMTPLE